DIDDHPAECLQPCGLVARRLDRHEHSHRQIDHTSVQQRHAPGNDAVLIEPPDPAPAGGGAQPHLFGDRSNGNESVSLQDIENSAVDRIHHVALHLGWLSISYSSEIFANYSNGIAHIDLIQKKFDTNFASPACYR